MQFSVLSAVSLSIWNTLLKCSVVNPFRFPIVVAIFVEYRFNPVSNLSSSSSKGLSSCTLAEFRADILPIED